MPRTNRKKISTADKNRYQEEANLAVKELDARVKNIPENPKPDEQQAPKAEQHHEKIKATVALELPSVNKIHQRKVDAINKILDDLTTQIDALLAPKDQEAPLVQEESPLIKVSRRLIADFKHYRWTYSQGKAKDITELQTLDREFIAQCSDALKQSSTLLQADLGYWDCFVNSLKSFIKTLFCIPERIGFFKPAQTPTMSTFSDAQERIALHIGLCDDYDLPQPTQ